MWVFSYLFLRLSSLFLGANSFGPENGLFSAVTVRLWFLLVFKILFGF